MKPKRRLKTAGTKPDPRKPRGGKPHPTAAIFRRIALQMPGAIEGAHMNHPDFRVPVAGKSGKIFATLGYPNGDCGMVRLSPQDQREICSADPETFTPVKGKWGEQGATSVRLENASEESLGWAITRAWKRVQG